MTQQRFDPITEEDKTLVDSMDTMSVGELLGFILDHRVLYPTHGANCACMDRYSQIIKRQIREVIKSPRYQETKEEQQAMWSLHHILQMVIQYL